MFDQIASTMSHVNGTSSVHRDQGIRVCIHCTLYCFWHFSMLCWLTFLKFFCEVFVALFWRYFDVVFMFLWRCFDVAWCRLDVFLWWCHLLIDSFVISSTGLFTADQNLKKDKATHTRQNAGGTRRGYECPEERDYFPYWHPTPWKDIVVLTKRTDRCDFIKKESFNVKPKGSFDFFPLSMSWRQPVIVSTVDNLIT